jgi:hypothetical protein
MFLFESAGHVGLALVSPSFVGAIASALLGLTPPRANFIFYH